MQLGLNLDMKLDFDPSTSSPFFKVLDSELELTTEL